MLGRRLLSLFVIATAMAFTANLAKATTYTCPSSESITIGTIVSGSYADLCAEDGVYEVLSEGLDGGVSKLRMKYTIPNVPVGTQYLKTFAPTGGLTIALGLTTTSTSTITILLADTDNSGSNLDTVTLDTVRIETR